MTARRRWRTLTRGEMRGGGFFSPGNDGRAGNEFKNESSKVSPALDPRKVFMEHLRTSPCAVGRDEVLKDVNTQKRARVPASAATHGPAEILLIEDNLLDAELTLEALRDAGFSHKVEHVSDGQEALDMIFEPKATPTLPKLVLLDLN